MWTQVTANWDVSMFEPLRFVTSSQVGFTNPTINKVTMIMTKVNEDLETNGETSDFWSLSEEVKTAEVGQFFLAYQIYINFDFHQHFEINTNFDPYLIFLIKDLFMIFFHVYFNLSILDLLLGLYLENLFIWVNIFLKK